MHCTVATCRNSVVVREPIPLCGIDAARLVIAYGQARFAAEEHALKAAAPSEPESEPEGLRAIQMTEQQARGVIAAAASDVSVRDLAALTGWSVGWVHRRRAEQRTQEPRS
jgi:hypothetical protein